MARKESLDVGVRTAPGYRRRIRVVPAEGSVVALLEDDIHAMAVRLRHDGIRVGAVEPVMERMPWTTCPGAAEVIVETFSGVTLAEVSPRKDRKANCTHLHDLAVIAAVHAGDEAETVFDISVSDPVDGCRELTLERNGEGLLHWVEQGGEVISPEELAGSTLLSMRDRISALPTDHIEAARMLQWAGLVAHGRTIPMADQSDASRVPPNCYTFQPERAGIARRIGEVIDFTGSDQEGALAPGESLSRKLGLAMS